MTKFCFVGDDFEQLDIAPLSTPPELPDVMKPQDSTSSHAQETVRISLYWPNRLEERNSNSIYIGHSLKITGLFFTFTTNQQLTTSILAHSEKKSKIISTKIL